MLLVYIMIALFLYLNTVSVQSYSVNGIRVYILCDVIFIYD